MKRPTKQRLTWFLFPKYSHRLDVANRSARVSAWLRRSADLPTFDSRPALYHFVHETYLRGEPLDFVEFGVAGGESLRQWSSVSTDPRSRFFGFDTFEGLPEDWSPATPKGSFTQRGQVPDFHDSRVRIYRGLFQETLPEFLRTFKAGPRLVVHHDSDLYSSVLYCLTKMDELCVKGTLLIFDEFTDALHEFRAFEDYTKSYGRVLRPIALASWLGVPQQVAFECG
jgi:O-methyltransferase